MGLAEDRDSVWHGAPIISTPLGEGNTFVDPEQSFAFRILLGSRGLLDHDHQVIDLIDDPFGQVVEYPIDDMLEMSPVHSRIQPEVRW